MAVFSSLSTRWRLIVMVLAAELVFAGGMVFMHERGSAQLAARFNGAHAVFGRCMERVSMFNSRALDAGFTGVSSSLSRQSAKSYEADSSGLDFYAVFNSSFSPVSSWCAAGKAIPPGLFAALQYQQGRALSAPGRFFLYASGTAVELRVGPLQAQRGQYIVAGKYLDAQTLRSLGEALGIETLSVTAPGEPIPVSDLATFSIRASLPLPGLSGQPVAYLVGGRSFPGLVEFRRRNNIELSVTLLFSVLVVLLGAIFIRRWVTAPLAALEDCLARRDSSRLAAVRSGGPEFTSIAEALEDYFRQRGALEDGRREHERLSASLRASEERFSVLVGLLEDNVFTLDREGRCTSFFGAPLMAALRPEEAVGKTMADLFGSAYGGPAEAVEGALSGKTGEARWNAGYGDARRVLRIKAVPLRGSAGMISGAVCVVQDVTDIARAEQKMRDAELDAKDFAVKLIAVREEEKKKLSYVMHDEVGSYEVAMSSALSMAEGELSNGNAGLAADALRRARTHLKELILLTKNISADLRPHGIEIAGLCGTLKELARKTEEKWQIAVRMECEFQGEDILSEAAKLMFFRVTQEALTNAVKHAAAKNVTIKLDLEDDYIVLSIEDNGRGFAISPEDTGRSTPHLGLRSMREYALSVGAKLEIETGAGQGACIKVRYPLPPVDEEEQP